MYFMKSIAHERNNVLAPCCRVRREPQVHRYRSRRRKNEDEDECLILTFDFW